MENEILEIRKTKALPNMVFSSNIKRVYFFEMPMPFEKILDLITCCREDDLSYTGLLWDELPSTNAYHIKNSEHFEKRHFQEKEETLWEYDCGYLRGSIWELYYDFKAEVLLFGLSSNHMQSFEHQLKNDEVLMKYHYALNDLIEYFTLIATANGRLPLEKENEEFLKELKLNYSDLATTVIK